MEQHHTWRICFNTFNKKAFAEFLYMRIRTYIPGIFVKVLHRNTESREVFSNYVQKDNSAYTAKKNPKKLNVFSSSLLQLVLLIAPALLTFYHPLNY